ncbi:hypothetical protein HPB51_009655 [Rhipicephalus microplus]|uniref:Uncharacterized protein n=1 Tax=Rhipicephalus microplus TaxID=6941 RepID=A0A9J6D9L1_RHIMP|nr:hypothetical protein HPB51_009655 [Rhipicephalus microplus]
MSDSTTRGRRVASVVRYYYYYTTTAGLAATRGLFIPCHSRLSAWQQSTGAERETAACAYTVRMATMYAVAGPTAATENLKAARGGGAIPANGDSGHPKHLRAAAGHRCGTASPLPPGTSALNHGSHRSFRVLGLESREVKHVASQCVSGERFLGELPPPQWRGTCSEVFSLGRPGDDVADVKYICSATWGGASIFLTDAMLAPVVHTFRLQLVAAAATTDAGSTGGCDTAAAAPLERAKRDRCRTAAPVPPRRTAH